MDFFDQEFGYTEREVTALMGAHTLGAADIFNSGFNGVWVSDEAVLKKELISMYIFSNYLVTHQNWRPEPRTKDKLKHV